ncbi:MAG: hydroxymethylbilane synthase, partial [Anaerolineales bacterium]
MAQTEIIISRLGAAHPQLFVQTKHISTAGDRDQRTSLAQIGGRGVFVKEIERSLLAGEIDLAVHSLKDVPTILPEGLSIGAVLPREDARDALISRLGLPLEKLPAGARVGTGSLRRAAQLRAFRLELQIVGLRGNVDSRLRKEATDSY